MVVPWGFHSSSMVVPWWFYCGSMVHGAMVVLWGFHCGSMVVPWWFHGGSMRVPWGFQGDSMVIPCSSMVVPWWFRVGSMAVPWWFHGGSMVLPCSSIERVIYFSPWWPSRFLKPQLPACMLTPQLIFHNSSTAHIGTQYPAAEHQSAWVSEWHCSNRWRLKCTGFETPMVGRHPAVWIGRAPYTWLWNKQYRCEKYSVMLIYIHSCASYVRLLYVRLLYVRYDK